MKIGIFGLGQMGSAMIRGYLQANTLSPADVLVKGGRSQTAKKVSDALGLTLIDNLTELAEASLILIATNPASVLAVLASLPEEVTANRIPIVSVAGGVSLDEMGAVLGADYPLAHSIPNTAVEVNQGVLGIAYAEKISADAKKTISELLTPLGRLFETQEDTLGVIGSVGGSAPAFVDVFIEALSDAAVLYGIDRKSSYQIVEQMIKGSAELALETGKHPAELKDGVTSPGGTTIKGIAALEANGFRHAVIEAVKQTMS